MIIQKVDEGESVGVIDRQLLIGIHNRMELMLSYQCKFLKVDVLCNNLLKFIFNQEKQFDRFLKYLKDKQKLSAGKYHFLRPKGTRPRTMYDLSKVHKS